MYLILFSKSLDYYTVTAYKHQHVKLINKGACVICFPFFVEPLYDFYVNREFRMPLDTLYVKLISELYQSTGKKLHSIMG